MSLQVRTGVDLLPLARFEKAWREGGAVFERRLFHPSELFDRRTERLAGVFAIKEAVAKALDLPPAAWLDIEVTSEVTGRPVVRFASEASVAIRSCDVSVSHAGGFVIAVCVVLSEEVDRQ